MPRTSLYLLSLALTLTPVLSARVCRADNPIIQTKYTADPAPLVYDGTVYLYTSHDEDDAVGFKMYNWMLYTSTDMANWTDHGIIGGVAAPNNTFPWAGGSNAWAPQTVEKNGKFYLYVPIGQKNGVMTIAVAVADSPLGPFKDALGKPLVTSGTSADIDPTVYIDTDGQAYLYWGNPDAYYVKLNPDMISYSGTVGKSPKIQTYQEGPWFYKRENNYYLAFASTCCPEGIGYAMSSSPLGPWTYKGSIMDGNVQSSGNHPGIIDYKGASYVFGFNYNVQLQRENKRIGERRSIAVEKLTYSADGTIPKLPFWSKTGPTQIESVDPYVQTEAETIAWAWDVKTETCSEGGMDVTAIENGDYVKVMGVDFGTGAASLDVRVASAGNGGNIEVRLDSQTGKLVGTCTVTSTGGAQTWATRSCTISGASGAHDVYFVFTGGSGSLFNFNWWKFKRIDGGTGGTGGAAGTGGASLAAGVSGTGAAGGAGSGGKSGVAGSGGLFSDAGKAGTSGDTAGQSGAAQAGDRGAAGSGKQGTSGLSSGSGAPGTGGASAGLAGAGGAGMPGITGASGSGGGTPRGGSGGAGRSTATSTTNAASGCGCEVGPQSGARAGFAGLLLFAGVLRSIRRRLGAARRTTP